MRTFDWEPPGPYRVAFSTRLGGVSEGAFTSLNLGVLTGDDAGRVVENRRRLCGAVGADAATASMARQLHGARVTKAKSLGVLEPGTLHEPCDGLWSDERGQAMMLVTADCLPIAVCRADGRAALTLLHVGWKGLLAGIVRVGIEALGGGPLAAAIGPGIGACCYEVGEEVAEPFRRAFGDGVVRGGHLDLATCAERALHAAGCGAVERFDLCTSCRPDLFFSHRRDRGRTGRQGVIGLIR